MPVSQGGHLQSQRVSYWPHLSMQTARFAELGQRETHILNYIPPIFCARLPFIQCFLLPALQFQFQFQDSIVDALLFLPQICLLMFISVISLTQECGIDVHMDKSFKLVFEDDSIVCLCSATMQFFPISPLPLHCYHPVTP